MSTIPKQLWLIIGVGFALLCLAYSNHFKNDFHFDDTHTIVNNQFVRDISNIPSFFTKIETFGTMPNNRSYRPVVTTLNAIDYWLGGKMEPFYFHVSIFFWYLVLLVSMYFFFRKIFNFNLDPKTSSYIAVLSVLFYSVHTANAETINYIIMRSDSFSTLVILASFLLYIHPPTRRLHLYLITLIIGIATKETGLMFVPLLFFYIYLFEQRGTLTELITLKNKNAIFQSFRAILPAIIVGILFFMFSRMYFRPEAELFFAKSASSTFHYFITQWYMIARYIGNFILPVQLSADPDYAIINHVFDQRILFSLALIITLVVIAFRSSKKHPVISYGILWFFIALAPTSSIIPFPQITNDHRTFFPYIGLVLALGYYAYTLLQKHQSVIRQNKVYYYGLPIAFSMLLLVHANGVYQRNKVWKDAETLWSDVAKKSPNNGRGLMNYGLTKMRKGEYKETLVLFERALQLMPYYSYLHVNMGILKNAMGDPIVAEDHFKRALKYDPYNVEGYYFYANWLIKQNRSEEAIVLLEKGHQLSPGHANTTRLLALLNNPAEDPVTRLQAALKEGPTAQKYLNISIAYYQKGAYQECIEACKQALALKPDFAEAYNNMCSAYILMRKLDEAKKACQKALEIKPDFELAKNNLKWAKTIEAGE